MFSVTRNNTFDSLPQVPSRQLYQGGSALIIVLAFLVLGTVLVLAFFTSVTTESVSAKSYANEVSTKELAESAMHCVLGAIRQATSQGVNIAWATQPGMIRTYGGANNTASNAPLAYYKLYSSDNMVVTNGLVGYDPSSDYDATWSSKPAMWVDLNSPITASGKTNFPIIDGNGIKSLTKTASGTTVPAYYGYDADGDGYPDVDGFFIDPAKVSYNPVQPLSAANNPVPMPVKWIYMLRDGTLTTPTSATNTTATWSGSGSSVPTASNPIVARMAFWTDDETSKININTASVGTFADTPVCSTQSPTNMLSNPETFDPNYIYEWDLAERQAAQHEYQRYPGHPATTSLSPVLGSLVRANLNLPAAPANLTGTNWAAYVQAITDVIPRISDTTNSSHGCTERAGPPNLSPGDTNVYAVQTDSDRLFASYDELAFNTLRAPQWASAATWGQFMETSKFFLTANSRAPELNLFNKPRVSIWPITKADITNPADISKMTPFDKMIAFCCTLTGAGSYPFYFSRQDPTSSTTDWSSRNQVLYSYLQTLTSNSVPGFGGGNFVTKYGTDRDQILTEIFDYIRCVNLADTSDGNAKSYTPPDTGDASSTNYTGLTKEGQVVPIVPMTNTPGSGTRGFGRIATIGQLGIAAMKVDNRISTAADNATNSVILSAETSLVSNITCFGTNYVYKTPVTNTQNVLLAGTNLYAGPNIYTGTSDLFPLGYDPRSQTKIQFVLLPDLFCPMAGLAALCNDISIKFTAINLTVTDKNGVTYTPFSATPYAAGNTSGTQPNLYDVGRIGNIDTGGMKIGGYMGIYSLVEPSNGGGYIPQNIGAPVDSVPPTGVITINGTSSPATTGTNASPRDSFTIAGNVTVEIHAPHDGPAIQTFTFTIPTNPPTTMAIPRLSLYANSGYVNIYSGSWAVSSSQYSNGLTGWSPYIMNENDQLMTNVSGTWVPAYYGTAGLRRGRRFMYNYYGYPGVINYGNRGDGTNGLVDSVLSLVATGANTQGDLRLVAARSTNDSINGTNTFQVYTNVANTMQHSLINSSPFVPYQYAITAKYGTLVNGFNYQRPATIIVNGVADMGFAPPIPGGINGVTNTAGLGDWDNGLGYLLDGPYVNKPDEGMNRSRYRVYNQTNYFASGPPYIGSVGSSQDASSQQNTFFSPNRMIPSAVMFGSLSTGVLRNLPWQTLLFRPAKSYLPGGINHPGAGVAGGTPPDHLLLDLFWMPVVEPYAISEPFSTAGKINMNYQIAPFTYLKRDAAMRAVLQSEKITAINPNQNSWTSWKMISSYKETGTLANPGAGYNEAYFSSQNPPGSGNATRGGGIGVTVRRNIDIDNTLRQFDALYFTTNSSSRGLFVSPSEICNIPLIPTDITNAVISSYLNAGITYSDSMSTIDTKMATFWNANKATAYGATEQSHVMTGDNMLERPYRDLYPRLTTKSNSYTVHVRVQRLAKIKSDAAQNIFNEATDKITGEYRGSFNIERYVDPNDPTIPDFASDTSASFDTHYRFRVLTTKQFGQ